MKAVADFNYKVALASGLKHLQGRKLRQAEEQFRYLVSKFPQADGGYRGLARVQVELGDNAAALGTLRDGAAALSRSGERAFAIELLREASTLDPLDLSAHRRLAAALALAGDMDGAAGEYVRFANAEVAAGDPDRARLEASYALETLGHLPALQELARSVGVEPRPVRRLAPEPAPPKPEPATPPPARVAAERPSWRPSAAEMRPPEPRPAVSADAALELEARAMSLLAARDPTAGAAAVEAARALVDSGKVHAASDLLLQLVASGLAVHEAQRELVAVAHALGRGEIAAEREHLLGTVSRLG